MQWESKDKRAFFFLSYMDVPHCLIQSFSFDEPREDSCVKALTELRKQHEGKDGRLIVNDLESGSTDFDLWKRMGEQGLIDEIRNQHGQPLWRK